MNGVASLKFERSEIGIDTLVCSYVGYQDKAVPVELNKSSSVIIEMTSSSVNLLEVVVTYQKPLSTKEILKNIDMTF